MERTIGNVVDSALFQRKKIGHHLLDTGRFNDACYGGFRDHYLLLKLAL